LAARPFGRSLGVRSHCRRSSLCTAVRSQDARETRSRIEAKRSTAGDFTSTGAMAEPGHHRANDAIWRPKRALMSTRKDLEQRILEVKHSLAGQDYQIAFLRDIAEAKKHDPTHSVHFNLKKAASKRRQLKIELDRLQARLRLQIRPPE
jgi:hypothetical protein